MTKMITADDARAMDRFAFIALYLVVLTRKAANRGPLGYRVNCHRGEYRVVSPIGGVVYATREADKLFDYARRTQLGMLTREADEFRVLAYAERQAA